MGSPIPTLLVFDEFCWETSSMSFRAALKRRAWSSPSLSLSLSLSLSGQFWREGASCLNGSTTSGCRGCHSFVGSSCERRSVDFVRLVVSSFSPLPLVYRSLRLAEAL